MGIHQKRNKKNHSLDKAGKVQKEIKAAYEKLIENEDAILRQGISITDDTMVYQHFFDRKVRLIEGGYKNIKITTPEDLLAAESFLSFFEKKC